MESKGHERTHILASLTEVTSPSTALLKTIPLIVCDDKRPEPCKEMFIYKIIPITISHPQTLEQPLIEPMFHCLPQI